jgi:hypothetical protein
MVRKMGFKPKHYNKLVRVLHEKDSFRFPVIEFSMQADSNEQAHDRGIQWIINNITKDHSEFIVEVVDYEGEENA